MLIIRNCVLRFSALVLLNTYLSAGSGGPLYSAVSAINGFLGNASHLVRSCADKPLKPLHESFAREVVEMLEVSCPVEFFELSPHHKTLGAHCSFSHIYLSAEELDWYLENNPDGARFVIAHELIHVLKFHLIQRFVKAIGGGLLAYYLLKNHIEKAYDQLVPQVGERAACLLSLASGCAAATTAYYPVLRFLDRLDEKEADCEAVRRLGKKLGLERAICAAEAYLTAPPCLHPSSFMQRVFATHPSLEERLTAIRAVTLA